MTQKASQAIRPQRYPNEVDPELLLYAGQRVESGLGADQVVAIKVKFTSSVWTLWRTSVSRGGAALTLLAEYSWLISLPVYSLHQGGKWVAVDPGA
jgi:hypothetical protein